MTCSTRCKASSTASSTRCPRSARRSAWTSRACRSRSASCSSRCCATATARRSPRSTCAQLANWQPNARAHRRDPVRRRARRAAGLHRRAAARRPRRDAQRRRSDGQEPEDRSSRWCRSTWSSTTRCMIDYYGTQGRARPQHEARVQAQPRALPVPEVGHAGVRHLQGRAARHRHRAPGQPRVPRARRASRRTASTIPTRWSAPTAHHDDQRHRRRRLGRRRHRGRGRHARPAGLLPDARRRRRRTSTGALREGVHRDRPGAHRHRDAAQGRRSSASSSSSSAKAPASLSVPDRATIANMAPEYGATMGFFPVDDADDRLLPRHRPHRRRDRRVRGVLQGAGPVRHAASRARSTTRRS